MKAFIPKRSQLKEKVMDRKNYKKPISYMDYSSKLQKLGVVIFQYLKGNRMPTKKEVKHYWLSRFRRNKVTPEDLRIRERFGSK